MGYLSIPFSLALINPKIQRINCVRNDLCKDSTYIVWLGRKEFRQGIEASNELWRAQEIQSPGNFCGFKIENILEFYILPYEFDLHTTKKFLLCPISPKLV